MVDLSVSNITKNKQQLCYGPLIQDNPGEPVLSQSRDLLEQPLDFYEPDVLPATQSIIRDVQNSNLILVWFLQKTLILFGMRLVPFEKLGSVQIL